MFYEFKVQLKIWRPCKKGVSRRHNACLFPGSQNCTSGPMSLVTILLILRSKFEGISWKCVFGVDEALTSEGHSFHLLLL